MAGAIERMSRTVSSRSRTGIVAFALVTAVAGAAAAALGASACSTTTTTNAALVSGIFIDHLGLLGDYGCGTTNDDVYKYVAVVINDNRDIGGAGAFDCFADGVFANMPGADAGQLDFAVWVYAYNEAAWSAANADNSLANAVKVLNAVNLPDGGVVPVPVTSVPDGGTTQGTFASALSTLCLHPATWVTTCSATTQPGVQMLANCNPLSLETTTPHACSLPVSIADGGKG
jgi:hypothetical protein